ncbi:unnamed protein product [Prorocentrum cordatum]|uniref:Uncharacterized protein n=1 Tax=Prorocentrum cordatum TaxID=2364126 RepID=A0ABN9UZR0_9DINO|nr:unnamed protein product [Polarella glacialis]
MYAMHGVIEHPQWFSPLTTSSSLEDIQRHLHGTARLSEVCLEPCAAQAQARVLAPEDCHTSVQGDSCYEEVLYAMQGVIEHPEWFSPLTRSSSMEDIQRHLHSVAWLSNVCPEPCAAQASVVPVPARLSTLEHCHTSVEGEDCYEEVMYAIQTGVVKRPDRYGNLTQKSSFEDFQRRLHSVDAQVCPEPCAAQAQEAAVPAPVLSAAPEDCRTTVDGDACYEEVMYAMHGVIEHPQWFLPLTTSSSLEDIQRHLHGTARLSEVCLEPCAAQAQARVLAPEDCHTSVQGDSCYEEVLYAMQGVIEHPEWFSPLTRSSSLEDIQRHLHSVAWLSNVCPEPCAAQTHVVPVPARLLAPQGLDEPSLPELPPLPMAEAVPLPTATVTPLPNTKAAPLRLQKSAPQGLDAAPLSELAPLPPTAEAAPLPAAEAAPLPTTAPSPTAKAASRDSDDYTLQELPELPPLPTAAAPLPTATAAPLPTAKAAPLPAAKAASQDPEDYTLQELPELPPLPTAEAALLPTTQVAPLPTAKAALLPAAKGAPRTPDGYMLPGLPPLPAAAAALPTTTAAPLPTEAAPLPAAEAAPSPTAKAAPLPIAEAGQAEKQTAEQGKATQASMSLQDLVAELEAKQRQLRALDERQKGLAELGAKQPELKEVTEAQQFNEQAAASEGLDFSSLPGLPPLFALPEPGAAPEPTLTRVYNAPAAPAAASPALEDCRTPIEGDDCYEEVLYAKQTGVVNHPHWYGNLTPDSSFDDFQWLLHSVSRVCPRPCAAQVQQLPTQARLPAAPSPLAASTKRAPAARAAPATSTRPHAAPRETNTFYVCVI